jgi:hypothetical protein
MPVCILFVQTSTLPPQLALGDIHSAALRAASQLRAQSHQTGLSGCIPLRGGEAVPSDGLCSVLRNTFTVLKHEAQVDLSHCMPLIRGKAEESRSLGFVLRNAATTKRVAESNHKVPKVAARRRALPSQRKPSRCIFRNTIACRVAAAECALAVRAAQRRPSRSQLKRSPQVLGHAWSAFKQHARQVRVRGRVLQQRRPPPALRRLAEALLPVQPLPLLEQSFALLSSVDMCR